MRNSGKANYFSLENMVETIRRINIIDSLQFVLAPVGATFS